MPQRSAGSALGLAFVSKVGLVLGGGGITGASFHFAVLLAIEQATGWRADDAEVVIGTSCGATVAAVIRGGALSIDALVGEAHGPDEYTERLRRQLYPRARLRGLARWARHGLLPGLRRPGLSLLLGSPAPFDPTGVTEWLADRIGPGAEGWPDRPTVIVAYDLEAKERVSFGTEGSPAISLGTAVAASCAVPMIYEPVAHEGRRYVDGGVASGTSADLVLGSPDPLDLVLVIAPMAAATARRRAPFYERLLDDAGRIALESEAEHIAQAWPEADLLVIRPDPSILDSLRRNPLSTDAAVPSFLRSLRSMRHELAKPEVWNMLDQHLAQPAPR